MLNTFWPVHFARGNTSTERLSNVYMNRRTKPEHIWAKGIYAGDTHITSCVVKLNVGSYTYVLLLYCIFPHQCIYVDVSYTIPYTERLSS